MSEKIKEALEDNQTTEKVTNKRVNRIVTSFLKRWSKISRKLHYFRQSAQKFRMSLPWSNKKDESVDVSEVEPEIRNPRSLFLTGEKDKPTFIFCHGYGSSYRDLLPLAFAFNQQGFNCELIQFKGHETPDDFLEGIQYQDWYAQVEASIHNYDSASSIYLVGFSLGASICLDIATKLPVKGIVAISTFISPTRPRLTHRFLRILKFFRKKRFKKQLAVSKKSTHKQLDGPSHFSVPDLLIVIDEAEKIRGKLTNVFCPVLFLHSLDDKVSRYKEIAHMGSRGLLNYRIITFRDLNHFIQFDVPSNQLYRIIQNYFKLDDREAEHVPDTESLVSLFSEYNEEFRHSASIVFQITIGFFTIFGAFLAYTLDHVIAKGARAPYILGAYVVVLSTYLAFVTSYFFYMNRITVYIRQYIEPQFRNTNFMTYKVNAPASGTISKTFTRNVSLLFILLPICVSFVTIGYMLYEYGDTIFQLHIESLTLQLLSFAGIYTLLIALISIAGLIKYTNRELYLVPAPMNVIGDFEDLVLQMYQTVFPGCVIQPDVEFDPTHNESI